MPSGSSGPVIVIGAGAIGLLSAWELSCRGIPSVVIDREAPAEGASCGNAGLVSYGHPPLTRPGVSWRGLRWMLDRRSPLLIRPRFSARFLAWMWRFHRHCTRGHFERCMEVLAAMGHLGAAKFDAIVAESGIDCGWRREGWLDVCLEPRSLARAGEEAAMLESLGFPSEPLDGAALRRLEPAYLDAVAGARRYELAATLDPRRLVLGLVEALRSRGGAFAFGETATGFLERDGRVVGVRTDAREHLGRGVLLAAGTWSDHLARLAGIDLPMEAARGYHLEFEGVDPLPQRGAVLHERFVAVTSFHGRLRLAGTLELAGLSRPPMRDRLEQLPIAAAAYLRPFAGAATPSRVATWSGYRPCLADGMPAIGEVPGRPGLVLATGHAMMGVTLGPATAAIAADLLTGTPPTIESPLLRPDRFRRRRS